MRAHGSREVTEHWGGRAIQVALPLLKQPDSYLGQTAKGTIWIVSKLGSKNWQVSCMVSGTEDDGVKGRLPRWHSRLHQSPLYPYRKSRMTGTSRILLVPSGAHNWEQQGFSDTEVRVKF